MWRTRLPFLDVTVGLVRGESGVLLVDTGSTLAEARAVAADVATLTGQGVRQIILTHNHFDHILGAAGFPGAEVYCAPEVGATMTGHRPGLRADALRHGADRAEIDRALAALTRPTHQISTTTIDLGRRSVIVRRPGRGHTDHDLIVVVPGEPTVVFCGDLVEQSGDPVIEHDSDLSAWPDTLDSVLAAGGLGAVFVPGHGAVVGAEFVRRQQRWLREQSGSR